MAFPAPADRASGEATRSRAKTEPTLRGRLLRGTALAVCGVTAVGWPVTMSRHAIANPQGGTVVRGSAKITVDPKKVTVKQNSSRAVIDWRSFSIDRGELTQFDQPDTDAIALNRVTGDDPSRILGKLKANGNVWLVNPNGVMVGKGAQVDVNGLLTTTANIRNDDFMAGRNKFDIPSPNKDATVVNEGRITIGERGLAALVAPGVRNSGVIAGKLGHVVLGGTPTFTIDMAGDGLINFAATSVVTKKPEGVDSLVRNDGTIIADGGTVLLTAKAASSIVDNVINMDGIVQARSVETKGGRIVLSGGDSGIVQVTGKVDATGLDANEVGGEVRITGEKVGLFEQAKVDVSGDAGGGRALIGGDFQGKGDMPRARRTAVGDKAVIAADARTKGDGGTVVVWSDEQTRYAGKATARGGRKGGNGGLVEVSSKGKLEFKGKSDTRAPKGKAGTTLLDPDNIFIMQDPSISNDGEVADGKILFDDGTDDFFISVPTLEALEGNVVLQATKDIQVTTGLGIKFTNQTAGERVTLQAGQNLDITGSITTKGADVILEADSPHSPIGGADGVGKLTIGRADVTTNGGDLTLIGADFDFFTTKIDAGLGAITLGPSVDGATLTIGGGSLDSGEVDLLFGQSVTIGRVTTAGSDGLGLGALVQEFGKVVIAEPLSPDGTKTLNFVSSGTISQNPEGKITVPNLGVIAGDAVTLTDQNEIDVFAASVSGKGAALAFNDQTGFSVGTVDGLSGVTTIDGNVSLTADGGGITITEALNAGAGVVTLKANGGSILQDGGTLIAGGLTGSATGTVTLDDAANEIDSLGEFAAGSGFTLTDSTGGLTVDKFVTSGSGPLSITTKGGPLDVNATLSGPNVALEADGALTLDGSIFAFGGTLSLIAGTSIDQTVPFSAGTLTGKAGTTVSLTTSGNSLASVGPFTAGAGFSLAEADFSLGGGLSVDGIVSGGTGLVSIETGDGNLIVNAAITGPDVSLTSVDDAVALNAAVTTPGTLTLDAGSTITQTTAFEAGTLTGTSGGATTLDAADNKLGNLGKFTSGGDFILADGTGGLTVDGIVTAGDGSVGLLSITTKGGSLAVEATGKLTAPEVTLSSLDDAISLDGAVTTPGTLTLLAGTSIDQSEGFEAAILTGKAGAAVALTSPGNKVDSLGAFATGSGFAFVDGSGDLTVDGAINGGTGPISIATLVGKLDVNVALSATDVTLQSGTSLTLDEAVTTPGTLTLIAGTFIDQAVAFDAGTLAGKAGTTAMLTKADNKVGSLGPFETKAGFALVDGSGGLSIGGAVAGGAGLTSIVTKGGDLDLNAPVSGTNVSLTTDGALSLDDAVATAGTLTLTAGTTVDQTVAFDAGILTGKAGSTATLTNTGNKLASLGAFTTGAGFALVDGVGDLSVDGLIDGGTGPISIAALGGKLDVNVALSATDVTLQSGTSLLLDEAVTTPGTLTLIAGTTIGQTVAFSASALTGSAGATATLDAANLVDSLGAFATGSGFTLVDAGTSGGGLGLTVDGPVTGGTGLTSIATDGPLTVNATIAGIDVTLTSGGALALNDVVTTPGTLTLTASTTIGQTAAFDAGTLTGKSGGTTTLDEADNKLGSLGAFTSGGDFVLGDGAGGLTVDGAVNAFSGLVSIATKGGPLDVNAGLFGADVTLATTGALTLDAGIFASGTLTLNAGTTIDQTVAFQAGTLTGSAGTTATLMQTGNSLASVGPFAAGAGFSLAEADFSLGGGLSVDGIVSGGTGLVSIETGDGNLIVNAAITGPDVSLISVDDAVALNAAVTTPGTLTLDAGSTITQTTAFEAGTLTGTSGGATTLDTADNKLGSLGAFTSGGDFILADGTGGLTVDGIVTAGGGSIGLLSITTKGGALAVEAKAALTAPEVTLSSLDDAVSLDGAVTTTGTLTLLAGTSIDQSAGFEAATLTGKAGAAVALTSPGNKVDSLGAFATGTGFAFVDGAGDLSVDGPIDGGTGPISIATLVGKLDVNVALSATDVTLQSGTSLLLDEVVTTPGTLTLIAGTFIDQAVAFDAGTLTGKAGTTATLTDPGNKVGSLDAFKTGAGFALVDAAGGLTVDGIVSGGTGPISIVALGGELDVNAGISGVAVTLQSGTSLTLDEAVTTPGTLTLIAGTLIDQTVGLDAGTLTGKAGSAVALTDQGNKLDSLGAFTTGSGFALVDGAGDLTVDGAISGGTGPISIATLIGKLDVNVALSAADVTLQSGTSLTLDEAVTTPGTLTLIAGTSIDQTVGFDAGILTGKVGTTATLTNTGNKLDSLGAFTTVAGFSLVDATGGLSVDGAVTGGTGIASIVTKAGALTVNAEVDGADVTLSAGTALALDAAVTTPGTLTLTAGTTIDQTAAFDVGTLTGKSGGTTTLDEAGNKLGSLGAFTSGGDFVLADGADGLTVDGAVSAFSGLLSIATAGGPLDINAGLFGADVTLTTTGALTLDAGITAPGTLTLIAGTTIDQTFAFRTGTLTGSAGTTATLTKAGNSVDSLGPFTAGNGFSLAEADASVGGGLSVDGTVTGGIGPVVIETGDRGGPLAVNAAITGPDVSLTSVFTEILLDAAVTTPGTLNLDAATTITQTVAFEAGTLTGTSGGATTLDLTDNKLGSLGPFTSGGNFILADGTGGLTVDGDVTAGDGSIGLLSITTKGGALAVNATLNAPEVTLASIDDAISLDGAVTTTGTLTLLAGTSIDQSIGFEAAALTGKAGATVALTSPGNKVDSLGVFATGSGFAFVDGTGDLSVDGLIDGGTGAISITALAGKLDVNVGISGVDVMLQSGTSLDLDEAVTTPGTLTLIAGTSMSQSVGFDAGTLTGKAGTTTTLTDAGNEVDSLGAFATGAGFALVDSTADLSVDGLIEGGTGPISIVALGGKLDVNVALAGIDVTLQSGASLTLDEAVTASGTLTLIAGTAIEQSAALAAGTLIGKAGTTATLTATGNNVGSLGAFTTGSGFALVDGAGDLSVDGAIEGGTGPISIAALGGKLDVNVALSAVDVALQSGTSLILDEAVTTPGTLALLAGTTIDQTKAFDAGTLTGKSGGTTTLTNAGNEVDNLGPFATGTGFTLADATGGLIVDGGVTGGTGLTSIATKGGDLSVKAAISGADVALTSDAALALNEVVTTPGTLTLTAGTTIDQTKAFDAVTLTGKSGGTTTLDDAGNTLGSLGAFTSGGDFVLADGTGGLTVDGAVSAFSGLVSIATKAGDLDVNAGLFGVDVTLATTAALTLDAGIFAPGTLTLNAGTTISQTEAFQAGTLTGSAGKATLTKAGNSLASVGPFTAGNGFSLAEADASLGGGLSVDGIVTGGTGAVVIETGDGKLVVNAAITGPGVSLTSVDDAIALNAVVTTPGTLNLDAETTITQTVAFDAGVLTGTSGGATTLDETDNKLGSLGPFTSGGNFILADGTGGLTVDGDVTAGDGSIGLLSITTKGGALAVNAKLNAPEVTLTSIDGAISLDGAVTTPGTLTLQAGASIDQSVGFEASALTGKAGAAVALTSADNKVDSLGAFATVSGFAFVDGAGDLSVDGKITGGTGPISIAALEGKLDVNVALTGADVTLQSGTSLTLDEVVTTPGTLTLLAGTTIAQTEAFNAGTLTGKAGASATLTNAGNRVGTLDAFATGAGFALVDGADGLSVDGAITGGTGPISIAALVGKLDVNVALSATDVTLQSGTSLTLDEVVATSGTLTLIAGTSIDQTVAFDAGTLTGKVGAAVTLTDAGNKVGSLGAFATGTGFALVDGAGDLSVDGLIDGGNGPISIAVLDGKLDVNVGLAGTDVTLQSGTSLTLDEAVTTPGTLTLIAGAAINQTVAFTAGTLTGSAGTTAVLGDTGNEVGSLGAFTTGAGFTLADATGGLSVDGTVTGGAGLTSIATKGGTLALNAAVTGADVTLTSGAALALDAAVTTSGALTLVAGTTIDQTAAFSAGTLTGSAGGATALDAGNTLGSLLAFTAGAGFTLADAAGGLIVDGVVSGGTGLTSIVTKGGALDVNAAVTGADVALSTDSTLTLDAAVTTPGTLTLVAGTSIAQTAAFDAGTLTGSAGTTATLDDPANAVGSLGAFATGAGFLLTNGSGTLSVDGAVTGGTGAVSIATVDGSLDVNAAITGTDVTLTALDGAIALDGAVTTPDTLTLQAGAGITQTVAFSAATLTGTAGVDVALGAAGNALDTLAGFTTTGGFTLADGSGGLTVAGPVAAGDGSVGLASIITTGGDLAVKGPVSGADVTLVSTDGAVDLDGAVTTPGTLTLQAGTSIGQSVAFDAGTLIGNAGTTAVLDDPANQLDTLAFFTTKAGFTLVDAAGGLTTSGIVDGGTGATTIRTTGDLTVSGAIQGAGVFLTAQGAGSVLTVNNFARAIEIASTGPVVLTGDDMVLNGQVDAAGNPVTLRPFSDGRTITLGANLAGSLSLTDAELDRITGGVLRIGRNDPGNVSGAITVAADISPANAPALHLISGADVTGTAGGIIVPGLAIEAGGPVVLSDPQTKVDTIAARLTGADPSFAFTTSGPIDIGAVDGVEGLGGSTVALTAGGAITQTEAIVATGAASLKTGAAPITLTDAGNDFQGPVSLANSGDNDVRLTDTGALTLGTVDVGGDLILVADTTITLTDDVTAGGNLAFDLPVLVAADVATRSLRGDVTFAGTVDSAGGGTPRALTVTAAEAILFGDTVGGTARLASLTATGETIALSAVNTVGAQTYAAGTATSLTGNLDSSGAGAIGFDGPVLLRGNVAIATAGGTGDDIRFGDLLDGRFDLTLTAGAGDVVFAGVVGGTRALEDVRIVSAADVTAAGFRASTLRQQAGSGTTTLAGPTVLDGATGLIGGVDALSLTTQTVVIDGAVTTLGGGGVRIVHAGLLTIGGTPVGGELNLDGRFIQAGTGPVRLAGGITTTGDAITFTGPLTLTGAADLDSAGGDITFSRTLDGRFDLVLTAGDGDILFRGAVGAVAALENVTIADAADVTVGSFQAATLEQQAGTGATRLDGPVVLDGATGLVDGVDALSLATQTVTIAGTVETQNGGGVHLTNAGQLIIAESTGRVDELILDGRFLQDGAGPVQLGGDMSTTGDRIRFTGPVTLTDGVRLASTGGDILFDGTIDGPQRLLLRSGAGDVVVDGSIGGADRLAFIDVDGNRISLQAVATTGGQVYTGTTSTTLNGDLNSNGAGAIVINGPALLGAGIAVSTAGGADDRITFAGTLDNRFDLVLTAGAADIAFRGAVGGTKALENVTVVSAGDVTAGSFRASTLEQHAGTGTTRLTGALALDGATGLIDGVDALALTTQAVTISGTVTTGNGGGVHLTNGGLLTIAESTGARDELSLDGRFLQDGAGTVRLGGEIGTTGDAITFGSATVLIDARVQLDSTGGTPAGADITFGSAVDSGGTAASDLTLRAGREGDIRFANAGNLNALGTVALFARNASIDFGAGAGAADRFKAGSILVDIEGAFTNQNLSIFGGLGLEVDAFRVIRAQSVNAFGTVGGVGGFEAALVATADRRSNDFLFNGCVIGEIGNCQGVAGEILPTEVFRFLDRFLDRDILRPLADLDDRLIEQPLYEEDEEEDLFSNRGNEELW